jgi:hypothetical protein
VVGGAHEVLLLTARPRRWFQVAPILRLTRRRKDM